MNMKDRILEFENVSFAYEREQILKDVTFSVERGDFVGIIGENGTGKTTIMKLMLGFLPYSEGSIRMFGEERKKFKRTELLGYVSQKANSFASDFPATVYEVVAAALYAKRGFFKRATPADKKSVDEVLEQVGMAEYKDRLIGRLSGGQQQRVFIARALIKKPEILILDEPTVGIDAKSVETVTNLISGLNKQGMTVIMTNHDTHSLKREANKIITLKQDSTAEIEVIR